MTTRRRRLWAVVFVFVVVLSFGGASAYVWVGENTVEVSNREVGVAYCLDFKKDNCAYVRPILRKAS